MFDSEAYFKGKKVTVMGLGLLGRGLGDTLFIAQNGADLIVTDMKTKEELKTSLDKLKDFKNIKFVLGEHRKKDFKNRDLILKASGVPLDSPYIKEAQKENTLIEMSAVLVAKLSGVKVVGITGTRGKSTTTHLIEAILKEAGKEFFIGGNVRGIANLPLLEKVREDDLLLMELDSWQLQGFGYSQISPHISVFTNLMNDHQNYYKNDMQKYFDDKANIFKFQDEEDFLVFNSKTKKLIEEMYTGEIKSKVILADNVLSDDWEPKLKGEHNRENISYAISVCRILDVDDEVIKKVVENFRGVPYRMELIREVGGVKYYNDTTATVPDATVAALRALDEGKKNIILLAGGADKELHYKDFVDELSGKVKKLILFEGTATDKIIALLGGGTDVLVVSSMKEAFTEVSSTSDEGDIVLLSPGAASFGIFKNEFDRGDQFNELVSSL
jgi:UDP-N-acetylmuramoylalanine--D-glutamate ligase